MSIAPGRITISKAGISREADVFLRAHGVHGNELNPEALLPRGADMESAVLERRKDILEGKGVEALARAPKTRPGGNISQMYHPLRGRMSELGNLKALNNSEIVDDTIAILTSDEMKPHFGYDRTVSKKGPFPFVLGGFDPSLDYDSSFLRPVVADDPEATKQLYEAIKKRTAGMSTGKYAYTADEMRAVVEEIKPIRDLLRYELMVGGAVAPAADAITVNRAVRTAVMLNSVATIPGSSDLTAFGLGRHTVGGRRYGQGKGARGHPAAALDLMGANFLLAAGEGEMPAHQRAIATHVFQNQLGPAAGFRAGRDAARQPGMPNLPVMPMTQAQAKAISRNVRELELFESTPTVEKAMKALGPEELLDRTEEALKKRMGADRMKNLVNDMFAIADDTGREWTDEGMTRHMLQKARGEMTSEDFNKLTEEIAQVKVGPKRAAPGVFRETRAIRSGGINPNTLKAEVRKTAGELGLRVRNPVMVAAMAGVILMGLVMARGKQEEPA